MATEGENDGASVYAHEFSHILGVLDNYNNSYATRRSANIGPVGHDVARLVQRPGRQPQPLPGPADAWRDHGLAAHAARQAAHGLPQAQRGQVPRPNALAATGPAFADVWAREIPLDRRPGATACTGSCITLTDGDKTPSCTVARTGAATAAVTRTTPSRSSTAWAPTRSRPTTGSSSPRTRPPSVRRGSGSPTPTPRTSTRSTSSARRQARSR